MDFADDVAYSVHDVEDGVVAGTIGLDGVLGDAAERALLAEVVRSWYVADAADDEIGEALDRLQAMPQWVVCYDGSRSALAALKNMTSQLIGRFCAAAERATRERFGSGPLTRYAADLVVPRPVEVEVATLKGIAALYVMTGDARAPLQQRQRAVLHGLVHALVEAGGPALEPHLRADWVAADSDAARRRVVIDQVASLTDVSAEAWHRRLLG